MTDCSFTGKDCFTGKFYHFQRKNVSIVWKFFWDLFTPLHLCFQFPSIAYRHQSLAFFRMIDWCLLWYFIQCTVILLHRLFCYQSFKVWGDAFKIEACLISRSPVLKLLPIWTKALKHKVSSNAWSWFLKYNKTLSYTTSISTDIEDTRFQILPKITLIIIFWD